MEEAIKLGLECGGVGGVGFVSENPFGGFDGGFAAGGGQGLSG